MENQFTMHLPYNTERYQSLFVKQIFKYWYDCKSLADHLQLFLASATLSIHKQPFNFNQSRWNNDTTPP